MPLKEVRQFLFQTLPSFIRQAKVKIACPELEEEKRLIMFSTYISEILKNPQKLILFNLDGILEIFASLDDSKKQTIANSIRSILSEIPEDQKRRLFLIIPQNARALLGI